MKRLTPQRPTSNERDCGNRRRPSLHTQRSTLNPRSGATLTEVLISLLAMGVGVVTVATLFPISILKSVKATQLTSSTILRYNAEAFLDIDPGIVFDPDNNGVILDQATANFIVDPLGHAIHRQFTSAFADTYGNDGTDPAGSLTRFTGRYTDPMDAVASEALASAVFASQDSWEDYGEFIVETAASNVDADTSNPPDPDTLSVPTGAKFDGATLRAMLSVTSPPPPQVRMILHRSDGRRANVRTVTGMPNDTTLRSTGVLNSPGEIERVRVQIQQRRYSWMLTVRLDPSGAANVDVVVFFNRGFDEANERVTTAEFTRLGTNAKKVTLSGYTKPDKPFLKKGGFILDSENALWYRIENVDSESDTNATITIDRAAQENSSSAIVSPGVVDAFHIGIRTPP